MMTTMDSNTSSIIHIIHISQKKKTPYGNTFDITLLETVDEIFASFGNSCKESIYFHLKNTFNISKQEIPLRIQDFANALEQLFGEGAKFIELKIIETLHKKTPNFVYAPPNENLVFADYVTSLRRFFLITNCKSNTRLSMQGKQGSFQLPQSKPYFICS